MRKSYVFCDTPHPGDPRFAAGRVGVQQAGAPVKWRDLCDECMAAAVKAAPLTNGSEPKRGLLSKLTRVLREHGPISGPELMHAAGIESKAVFYRQLRQVEGLRKRGRRAAMRYSLPAS